MKLAISSVTNTIEAIDRLISHGGILRGHLLVWGGVYGARAQPMNSPGFTGRRHS